MLKEMNILVVDDYESERKELRELFSRCSFVKSIYDAAHGKEALERIQNEEIDVVILDQDFSLLDKEQLVCLPGDKDRFSESELKQEQGIFILQWLKQELGSLTRFPVVIFTTNHNNHVAGNKAIQAGASSYHAKSDILKKGAEQILLRALSNYRRSKAILHQLAEENRVSYFSPIDERIIAQHSVWRRLWPDFCDRFLRGCKKQGLLPVEYSFDILKYWDDFCLQQSSQYETLSPKFWEAFLKERLIEGKILNIEYIGAKDHCYFFTNENRNKTYVVFREPSKEVTWTEDDLDKLKYHFEEEPCCSWETKVHCHFIPLDREDPYIATNVVLCLELDFLLDVSVSYEKRTEAPQNWISAFDFAYFSQSLTTSKLVDLSKSLLKIWEEAEEQRSYAEDFLWFKLEIDEIKFTLLPISEVLKKLIPDTFTKKSFAEILFLSLHGWKANENTLREFVNGYNLKPRFPTTYYSRPDTFENEIVGLIQDSLAKEHHDKKIAIFVNPNVAYLNKNLNETDYIPHYHSKEVDIVLLGFFGVYFIEVKSSKNYRELSKGVSQCRFHKSFLKRTLSDPISFIKKAQSEDREEILTKTLPSMRWTEVSNSDTNSELSNFVTKWNFLTNKDIQDYVYSSLVFGEEALVKLREECSRKSKPRSTLRKAQEFLATPNQLISSLEKVMAKEKLFDDCQLEQLSSFIKGHFDYLETPGYLGEYPITQVLHREEEWTLLEACTPLEEFIPFQEREVSLRIILTDFKRNSSRDKKIVREKLKNIREQNCSKLDSQILAPKQVLFLSSGDKVTSSILDIGKIAWIYEKKDIELNWEKLKNKSKLEALSKLIPLFFCKAFPANEFASILPESISVFLGKQGQVAKVKIHPSFFSQLNFSGNFTTKPEDVSVMVIDFLLNELDEKEDGYKEVFPLLSKMKNMTMQRLQKGLKTLANYLDLRNDLNNQ